MQLLTVCGREKSLLAYIDDHGVSKYGIAKAYFAFFFLPKYSSLQALLHSFDGALTDGCTDWTVGSRKFL